MKCALMCVAFIVTLPFVASGQRRDGNAQPLQIGSRYQAIVGKEEAVFIFPIPVHRRYEFSDRGLLGIHVIKLRNIRNDYEFGFYIDNPLDGALGMIDGNLDDLLNAPLGFFKAFKLSKQSIHDLTDIKVEGFADDNLNKLTIKVSGKTSVNTLFSGRAKYCIFESRIRDGAHSNTSVRVPIVYGP